MFDNLTSPYRVYLLRKRGSLEGVAVFVAHKDTPPSGLLIAKLAARGFSLHDAIPIHIVGGALWGEAMWEQEILKALDKVKPHWDNWEDK
jgi:hypothetical protein